VRSRSGYIFGRCFEATGSGPEFEINGKNVMGYMTDGRKTYIELKGLNSISFIHLSAWLVEYAVQKKSYPTPKATTSSYQLDIVDGVGFPHLLPIIRAHLPT
jgi:hypothetical protein